MFYESRFISTNNEGKWTPKGTLGSFYASTRKKIEEKKRQASIMIEEARSYKTDTEVLESVQKVKESFAALKQDIKNASSAAKTNSLSENAGSLVNALSVFSLKTPKIIQDTLMIDIETAGLKPGLPIIQIASGQVGEIRKLGQAAITERNAVPIMGFLRDIGPSVTGDLDFAIRPVIASSLNEFVDKFGSWAVGREGYQVEAFYKAFEELSEANKGKYVQDMLTKDAIRLSDYHTFNLKEPKFAGLSSLINEPLLTPRGIAVETLKLLGEAKEKNLMISAANLSFESLRLGQNLSYFLKNEQTALALDKGVLSGTNLKIRKIEAGEVPGLESIENMEEVKKYLESAALDPRRKNILDATNLDYKIEKEKKFGIHLFKTFMDQTRPGIRTFDIQEMVRLSFSGAMDLGLIERSDDVYTGTNVDILSRFLLGTKEKHLAGSDVEMQAELLDKYIYRGTRALYSARNLESDSFFQRLGSYAGIFKNFSDERVGKYLGFLQSIRGKQVEFDFADVMSRSYKGTAVDILGERSAERQMLLMDQSLRSFLDLDSDLSDVSITYDKNNKVVIKSKNREFFTIRKTEEGIANYLYGGELLQRKESFVTGKETDLVNKVRADFNNLLNMGMSKEEAFENVRNRTLEDFLAQKSGSKSKEVFESALQRVSTYVEDSQSRKQMLMTMFEQGDSIFKEILFSNIKMEAFDIGKFTQNFMPKLKGDLKLLGAGVVAAGFLGSFLFDRNNPDIMTLKDAMRTKRGEGQDTVQLRKEIGGGSIDPNTIGETLTTSVEGISDPSKYRSVSLRDFKVDAEDGDTLYLMGKRAFNRNVRFAVRLQGIDSPETAHGDRRAQEGSRRAAVAFRKLLESDKDVKVALSTDQSTYDRNVGFLYKSTGENINLTLVRQGNAAALTRLKNLESDTSFDKGLFEAAERDALANRRGLWSYGKWYKYGQSQERDTFNVIARSQFSAKDDNYNTIEALGHKGIAHTLRSSLTDFGSGYTGLAKGIERVREFYTKLGKKGLGLYAPSQDAGDAYNLVRKSVAVKGVLHGFSYPSEDLLRVLRENKGKNYLKLTDRQQGLIPLLEESLVQDLQYGVDSVTGISPYNTGYMTKRELLFHETGHKVLTKDEILDLAARSFIEEDSILAAGGANVRFYDSGMRAEESIIRTYGRFKDRMGAAPIEAESLNSVLETGDEWQSVFSSLIPRKKDQLDLLTDIDKRVTSDLSHRLSLFGKINDIDPENFNKDLREIGIKPFEMSLRPGQSPADLHNSLPKPFSYEEINRMNFERRELMAAHQKDGMINIMQTNSGRDHRRR